MTTAFMALNVQGCQVADELVAANQAATIAAFDNPASFVIGFGPDKDPRPAQLPLATPVLQYKSYAAFQSDLTAGAIDRGLYSWVMYDPENWPQTPAAEINDPWEYLPAFIGAATGEGFRCIVSPARDLGTSTTSAQPRQPDETLEAWYIRTGIATASSLANVLSVQNQADELDSEFATFYGQVVAQAQAASPAIQVWAGVRSQGAAVTTGQQIVTAAQSINAPGYWVNSTPDTATIAGQFLQIMTGS